ncbi:MAG: hypothetical protein IPL70_11235 [Uliginosibacterium sp.]|nr:hypothetical protein [Uliginosibacterium sp.]
MTVRQDPSVPAVVGKLSVPPDEELELLELDELEDELLELDELELPVPLDDELLELEDELLDALALVPAGLTLSDPPPPPPQAASRVRTVSGRMRRTRCAGRVCKAEDMRFPLSALQIESGRDDDF